MSVVVFWLLGIQIGFALAQYSFDEPDFETIVNDIVLVREGGRLSEQTFQVSISVGGTININPATLEFEDEDTADYRLTALQDFIALDFPPDRQNITLSVILFRDDLPEGTEAFRATSTPSQNFPNFAPPSMGGAFASTYVLIFDDDRKLACKCAATCYNVSVSLQLLLLALYRPSILLVKISFSWMCVSEYSTHPQMKILYLVLT